MPRPIDEQMLRDALDASWGALRKLRKDLKEEMTTTMFLAIHLDEATTEIAYLRSLLPELYTAADNVMKDTP